MIRWWPQQHSTNGKEMAFLVSVLVCVYLLLSYKYCRFAFRQKTTSNPITNTTLHYTDTYVKKES